MAWFALAILLIGLYIFLWTNCFRGDEHQLLMPVYWPDQLAEDIRDHGGILAVTTEDSLWLEDQLTNVHTTAMGFSVLEGVLEPESNGRGPCEARDTVTAAFDRNVTVLLRPPPGQHRGSPDGDHRHAGWSMCAVATFWAEHPYSRLPY